MGHNPKRPVEYDAPRPSDDDLEERRIRLIQERLDIDTEIDGIKTQLEMAAAKARTTGEYSDPVWYAKAKAALRYKGRAAQEVQAELSDIRDAIKARNTRADTNTSFVVIAEARLDPELFAEIMEEAKARNIPKQRPREVTTRELLLAEQEMDCSYPAEEPE